MDIHSYIDEPVSKRQQTIYNRTYSRNIPSHMIQPYLDSRPIMTKYTHLSIVDKRNVSSIPVIQHPTFSHQDVFHAGINSGPWSGFASNINHESELRNQIYALQSNNQAVYIPSSTSSLYNVKWHNHNVSNQKDPFPNLCSVEHFNPFNPNPNDNIIGFGLFNNHTRQQNKDLTI